MQSSSSGASYSSRLTAALLFPHIKEGFGLLQVIYLSTHSFIHPSTCYLITSPALLYKHGKYQDL